MTFEITYTGECRNQQIFYSTVGYENPATEELCKKMDLLAKEIKKLKTEEENVFPIEDKVEEMVVVVQKHFTKKVVHNLWEDGDENYSTHNPAGKVKVDGEEIELDKDFFGDDHEKWDKELRERLNKLDWHIIFYKTYEGFHNNGDFDGIEGEFDKKKIKLKDTCIYYDDESIDQGDGCDWTRELVLNVGNDESMEVEPLWGEE